MNRRYYKLSLSIICPLFFLSQAQASTEDAKHVAASSELCKKIEPFYWEIGDKDKVIISGVQGGSIDRNSKVKIASASKLIFGAYVIEKLNGVLNSKDKSLLLMQGGYTEFKIIPCALRRSVKACFEARNNNEISNQFVGKYYYSGGDAQDLAVQYGLGDMNRDQLKSEIQNTLKNKFSLKYPNLSLAGGVEMDASNYAIFLQEILKGNYRIAKMLGDDAICTLPGACKTAVYSPIKENWKYSYHHWVETNAAGEVDVYSSAGAKGFYPWINKEKNTYGIISRDGHDEKAAWASVECGREIRRAYKK